MLQRRNCNGPQKKKTGSLFGFLKKTCIVVKVTFFQNHDSNMFLKSPIILKLSEEQKASCEGRISKEEYKQALEFFESGKTSGNDRLPVELNKHFWFSLEDYLTASFTSSFEYEEISNSQNK